VCIVNGAHTDLMIGTLLVGAIIEVERRRTTVAALALAAAVLVKVVALLPALALGIWVWRRGSARDAARIACIALPVIAGAYLLVGGMAALEPVREAGELFGSRSQAWEILRQSWSDSYAAAGMSNAAEVAHLEVARWATPIVAAMAVLVLVRLTRRRDPAVPVAGAGLGFALTAAYVLPWYSGWTLPTAATAWRSPIGAFVQAQAALIVLVYADPPGYLPPEGPLLELSTYWLPLVGVGLGLAFAGWALLPSRDELTGDDERSDQSSSIASRARAS
jgi:hypothetical protein